MGHEKERVLFVVDGGTTHLRVTMLDAVSHKILGFRKTGGGVRHTAEDGHNGRLKGLLRQAIHALLDERGLTEGDVSRCIAYGMITSPLGLLEVPHLAAPASAEDLCLGMVKSVFPDIADFLMEFIPGVRNFLGPVDPGSCGGMDMMRGEETEAVGLYRLLGLNGRRAIFVLPGSHNKFVRMGEGGEILGCLTSISGELTEAITKHTILLDAVKGEFATKETCDGEMVRFGAQECLRMGLGRAAFAGRILSTLGGAGPEKIQSWLLGAVLAEDAKALGGFAADSGCPIFIAGGAPVQNAFLAVLEEAGIPGAACVDENISARMGTEGALAIAGAGLGPAA